MSDQFEAIKATSLCFLRTQPIDSLQSDSVRGAMARRLLDLLNRQLGGQSIAEVSIEITDPGIG